MSSGCMGTDSRWPRVPKFEIPDLPPGKPSGDHIALDEDDERILDKVWADIRKRPARLFGRTLPPLVDDMSEADSPANGTTQDLRPAAEANAVGQDGQQEAGSH